MNDRKGAASGEANVVLVIVAIILVIIFMAGPFKWIVQLFLGSCFLQVIMVVVLIASVICTFIGKK